MKFGEGEMPPTERDPWRLLVSRTVGLDKPPEDAPYGYVQWKGTDACLDLKCTCGALTHLDGERAYVIKCVKCGRVFWVQPYVLMTELEGENLALAEESEAIRTTEP